MMSVLQGVEQSVLQAVVSKTARTGSNLLCLQLICVVPTEECYGKRVAAGGNVKTKQKNIIFVMV